METCHFNGIALILDGDLIPAYHDSDIVAYFRVMGSKHALAVVNRGPTNEISMEILSSMRGSGIVLKEVHGHISEVRLQDKRLKITVNSQNSLILAN